MHWLDPSLKEAAHRLLIYQTLKAKANAIADLKRIENKQATDEEEKVKHERWLRKLHLR